MLKMNGNALCRNVVNCVPDSTAAAHPKDLKRQQQRCQNLKSRIFYFRCYTVHVVKSLNYFTNHCTYIHL